MDGTAVKRRGGKPSKLTPELADRLGGLLAGGTYRLRAAGAVGVDVRRLYDWLRWGRLDLAAGRDTVFARLARSATPAGPGRGMSRSAG